MTRGRYRRPAASLRFAAKTRREGECVVWTGARSRDGYGLFWHGGTMVLAHRWAYEQARGPIPAGRVLDHRCRNHACVRVTHLEPVTSAENTRRGAPYRINDNRRFSRADVDR